VTPAPDLRIDAEVVVVGAGIAGLATALALARVGHPVRVLERDAEPGETGFGLQLAPNATRVLRAWGLLDELTDQGVLPRRAVLRDAVTGRELTHVDLHDAERRYRAPYVLLRRSTLHTVLLRACAAAGVEIVTGVTVTDVERAPSGSAVVTAVSATRRDRARVVVAADGLRSRLRGLISADDLRDTGYLAHRGVRPVAELAGTGVALDETVLFVGPDRHFVQYPLDHGESVNHVAVFRPRFRIADVLRGPADHSAPFTGLGEPFARDCAHVRQATRFLDPDRSWTVYDRDPIPRWVDRRLVLVGDAAHPMLQYFAQGACQAIEDADALARASREHRRDWDAALLAYAGARIPRTAEMQLEVRAWGDFLHAAGAAARERRNDALRHRAPDDYARLDWLYADRP
jgi:salicylate hydroxylase